VSLIITVSGAGIPDFYLPCSTNTICQHIARAGCSWWSGW